VLQPGVGKVAIKTVAILDKNGVLTGTTTTTASGPYAITLRLIGLEIQAGGPAAATRLLTASGYQNASGTFTQGSPTALTPDYTISSTFNEPGWTDNLSGKNSFFMPPGLRLFDKTGDYVMGPFNPGKLAPDEPTVCYSAEQSEDFSLTAPAGYRFDAVPHDVRVETPNLLFIAHWSLTGNMLRVHRDFTSKIDQPLCTGTTRSQSAAALKKISDSYDTNLSFTKTDRAADKEIPDDASNFLKNGSAHLSAHQYQLAISDFDKAIALKPDDYILYDARASAHVFLRQYDLAMTDFNKAVALKPDDVYSYTSRAYIYRIKRKYGSAIADYNRLLTLKLSSKQFYTTYYQRGMAYWKSGRYAPAIADFDKVIAIKPDFADAFLYRGDAENRLGRKKDGNRDIATALKLNPALGK
jgi:Tfp pilus assembly protein PilF